MATPVDDQKDGDYFDKLFQSIGSALFTWQYVEEEHFKLFFKMLGAPNFRTAAVAYYSTQTFAARHTMVSYLARVCLEGDKYTELRNEWNNEKGGLLKAIKDANLNRNKIAHYATYQETIEATRRSDGSTTYRLGDHRLQPAPYDVVSKLIGWTPDRPEHNLGPSEIWKYSMDWDNLAFKLHIFQRKLPFPPQLSGASLFLSTHKGQLMGPHLFQSIFGSPEPGTSD